MKLMCVGLLFAALLTLFHVSALGVPISPRALERAQRLGTLSEMVFVAPPEGVDEPFPISAQGPTGNYKILLIVIEFSDVANVYSRASFDSMAFNGWSTGTMDDYYAEVSYGNLTLSGEAKGWYTASQGRAYYGNGQKGWGTYPQNAARLVEEAVDAAEAAGCDFSQYDNDNDGIAESIIIVHTGEGYETSLDSDDIQSHVSTITNMGGTARSYDGVTIDRYACCPEFQSSAPTTHVAIGVYCHEYAHILGLPDLYDAGRWCTGTTSWGIGAWGLMSTGSYGGDVQSPETPVHMCAWSKIQMGWLAPMPISGWSQLGSLDRVEQYPQAYKVGMDSRETQYFLLEYRDSSYGFDKSLVKKGLVIYHIDDDSWSQNDCENGGACTSSGFNYMVAVEQPDSSFDLDCGTALNYADRGDIYPYRGIDYFDASTIPNANTYEGTASGVSVSGIAFNSPTQMRMYITGGNLYPEIVYDDSFFDICWRFGFNDAGFALKMTPGRYPALVRGLLIMSCDAYNTDFQCRIWDDSGPSGTPGSPLSPLHTVYGAPSLAWTYEDFTADSINVASGDFWAVYIEYNNSQLASDNSSAWSGRTMTYYSGNFSVDNGAYGNYMMRSVVDTVFCAGVETAGPQEIVAHVGPNPFKEKATISFTIERTSAVSLSVYDVSGRSVKRLASKMLPAGSHSITWDGTDSKGKPVPAGVYFYRFSSGDRQQTGKMSLLR